MSAGHSPPDIARVIADAKPEVFWSDRPDAPEARESVRENGHADLVVIGSGFTGLWAALQAVERDPGRRVMVIEAERCGFGASSRNGGFCDASLTHGLENGLAHWPKEIGTLQRLGDENLTDLLATATRFGIEADIRRVDEVSMAVASWQVADLAESAATHQEYGVPVTLVDGHGAQAIAKSPTYLGALVHRDAIALVDPARLCWGLRSAAESMGVEFHDNTRVSGVDRAGGGLALHCPGGTIRAEKVIVATNAWAEPVRRIRRYVIPVYDHVLMTEPLTEQQMAAIGWSGRAGLSDSGSQFHYYRLTEDNRILWGGYDANYYRGNGMGPDYEQRRSSFELIAGHFYETFPQLESVGFTHRWAGPIGTTSRFSCAWGLDLDDRLAWAAGYTGLGVGASRFGAAVALDLVDAKSSERTELAMVRNRPVPFPPEPLRNLVIQHTRRAIADSDANDGKPGPWLRLLARFGVGFDS